MHVLQSKHIKLKEDEISKLLSQYNISRSQLPKIKHSDPALVELNAQKGDIIKILRKCEEGELEYFRLVV